MLWSILFILLFICYISFIYGDLLITADQGLILNESIFSGNFFNFYQNGIERSAFGFPPVYSIAIYIIFALWNIPIYILHMLVGLGYQSGYSIMWSKLMVVVFLIISAWLIYKICLQLNLSKNLSKWAIFIFLSSTNLIMSSLVITQYDIISITFMLIGLLMYIRGNIKQFILWFSISITMKVFAIFIFIPLIMLKEKRIFKILIMLLLGLIPTAFCELLFLGNDAYKIATASRNSTAVDQLIGVCLPGGLGSFSIFIFAIGAIYIYSYITKIEGNPNKDRIAILICLAVYTIFFCFAQTFPYWIILMVPFTTLVIVQNINRLKINIILDILLAISYQFVCQNIFYWCYSDNIVRDACLPKIFGATVYELHGYHSLQSIYTSIGINKFTSLFLAVFICCSLVFIIINYPYERCSNNKKRDEQKVDNGIILLRMLICIPFIIGIITSYFYTINLKMELKTTQYNASISSINLLNNKNEIQQVICFDHDVNLDTLNLKFENENVGNDQAGSFTIKITDKSSGKSIFSKRTAFNMLKAGEITSIKMNGVKLIKENYYIISISGQDGKDKPLNIYFVDKVLSSDMPLYINGIKTDKNLFFELISKS
jgi:hypothetical protein